MGNQIRKYFILKLGKTNSSKINIKRFKFVLIAFLIIISGCETNKVKYQKTDNKTPSKIIKQELNCTGYIKAIQKNGNSNILTIDTVEMYNGEAAEKAFNKDKNEGKNKINEITDGYYISNSKVDSLKFRISDTANVIMQTLSYNQNGNYNFNEKIQISKLISLLNNKEYQRFKFKLYDFHILNNEIVSIKEVYLP